MTKSQKTLKTKYKNLGDKIEKALDQVDEKPSTDYIVNDVAWHNTLFCDQYREPWISIGGDSAELYPIGSESFKHWLGGYVYKNYHFALKNNQVRDITNALKGIALYDGKGEKRLEARSCFTDKALLYDLGDKAVRITRGSWQVINKPPIVFRRFNHQEKQVLPVENGDIQSLRQFVNIQSDDDWLLFLTFAITAFIPDIPKPMLVLNGSQGAGKSTPMRMLKKLVDPSIMLSSGAPKGTDELARLANRHTLLFFDNLSNLSGRVSDDLCRLVTGDGFSKRTLYTNDGETIFTLKRAIMMNGINPFITRADLLDRTIILEVERIPEDKRLAEYELWAKFEAERPKILGGIFTVLAKALSIYPTVKAEKLPRMADFYKWGLAINQAISDETESFKTAYEKNIERQVDEAIQANPVALAAIKLTEGGYDRNSWEGTATEFFDRFESSDRLDEKYLKRSVMWAQDPSGIGRALKRAEASLKFKGIKVEHFRRHNERMIRVTDETRSAEIEAVLEERAKKEAVDRERLERENAEAERLCNQRRAQVAEENRKRDERCTKNTQNETCDEEQLGDEVIPF